MTYFTPSQLFSAAALLMTATFVTADPIPYSYGRTASFSLNDSTVVFMNSANYTEWDFNTRTNRPGFPQPLTNTYKNLFGGTGVDAAVRLFGSNTVYFFKGDEYITWDMNKFPSFDQMPVQTPDKIANAFPGVFDGKDFDAAMTFDDNRLYFFKGDQYLRWDVDKNSISTAIKYPAPIKSNWPGMFNGEGVDYAVRYDSARAYFYKGDKYVRWDIKNDKISTAAKYPKDINSPGGYPNLLTGAIEIGPHVPHDLNRPDTSSDQFQVEKAQWAWKQFVALGWKSIYDPDNNVLDRGVADTSWHQAWSGPDAPTSVVWETYAHRTELRPYGQPLTKDFNSLPEYVSLPYLDGRILKGKNESGGPASFLLLNNLDEDNEIGSADIYLGDVNDKNRDTAPLVLYQAKSNRDEYDYLKKTFGHDQYESDGTLAKAAKNNAANIKNFKAYYKGPDGQPDFDTCNVPSNVEPSSTIVLPCGVEGGQEGAIEIKTAFYRIPAGKEADFKNFLVRDAIYYTKETPKGSEEPVYTYHNGKFALLGMHIIHKTTNFPGFIFTSFEHRDLSNMDFSFRLISPLPPLYGSFNPHGAKDPKTPGGTQIGDYQPIARQSGSNPTNNGQLYPIPPQFKVVNDSAQQQLASFDSPWQHYQVIGVQAEITDGYSASPSGSSGPNHYMANHVIESDAFLGNFFGPGFSSTKAVFPTGNKTFPDGSQNGDNVLYQGTTHNVGGCKGCHGVAQTAFGTDFSFLMDFSSKPVTEIDTIFYVQPN